MNEVLELQGDLTRETIVEQIGVVQAALASGARVIDLGSVALVDSTCMSLWLEVRRSQESATADIEWRQYPEQMQSIARLVGIDLNQ